MKRSLLPILFLLMAFSADAIIYWQPYPITAVIATNGNQKRIECAVYDSVLGAWMNYYTPYSGLNYVLTSPSTNTVITFRTNSQPPLNLSDTVAGFIIYDPVLHQFMPRYIYWTPLPTGFCGNDIDYDVGAGVFDNSVETWDNHCAYWYTYGKSFFYDVKTHVWKEGFPSHSNDWDWQYVSLRKGGVQTGSYDDFTWDPGILIGIFDPVDHEYKEHSFSQGPEGGGTQDLFSHKIDLFLANSDVSFSVYNPLSGGWTGGGVNMGNGCNDPTIKTWKSIFVIQDTNVCAVSSITLTGIYDDVGSQWKIDTLDFFTDKVKIKQGVVAYTDNAVSKVYCLAFSPTLREWIKDSVPVTSLDTLYIQDGTVTWIDGGTTYIRGYNDTIGWGNFNTPAQISFYITDLYQQCGWPLIYVRNYSIGTDTIYYDFGDGVITSGDQPSLYHLYKVNNNYRQSAKGLSATPYTVCASSDSVTWNSTACQSFTSACTADFTETSGCPGMCNGTASVTPVTGTAPFTYAWSTGGTTSSISALCIGTYTVTVTDSTGCSITHQSLVTTMDVSASIPGGFCIGSCDNEISVYPFGGTYPYSYQWSNGDTTSIADSLCANTYLVTITDAGMCSATHSYDLSQNTVPGPNIIVDDFSDNCNGCAGEYEAWVISGTGPFTYLWSTGDTIEYVSGLCPGTYTITVTDANGCSTVDSMIYVSSPTITFSVTPVNATCFGYCNGSFIANITGGTPPFTFKQCNGQNITPGSICPGTYCIRVTDSLSCIKSTTLIITDPPLLSLSVLSVQVASCGICNDGYIAINTSGGTLPYNISWTPNTGYFLNDTIYNLTPGVYQVTLTDSNGCTSSMNINVSAVGIEEAQGTEYFDLFPNPVKETLTVSASVSGGLITIYNVLGERLQSTLHSGGKTIMNCKGLSRGIYFITLQSDIGRTVKKFVKE